MQIQTLILFKFSDTPKFYGEFNINATNPQEAQEKLAEYIKETNYIKEHPSMFETMVNNFKMEEVNLIDAVIL